jgi:hypothetical protein
MIFGADAADQPGDESAAADFAEDRVCCAGAARTARMAPHRFGIILAAITSFGGTMRRNQPFPDPSLAEEAAKRVSW